MNLTDMIGEDSMFIIEAELFKVFVNSLVQKYSLILTSNQCAEALGITSRTLAERRRKARDIPQYLDSHNGKKGIYYPVQNIVKYQMEKTKKSVKIMS